MSPRNGSMHLGMERFGNLATPTTVTTATPLKLRWLGRVGKPTIRCITSKARPPPGDHIVTGRLCLAWPKRSRASTTREHSTSVPYNNLERSRPLERAHSCWHSTLFSLRRNAVPQEPWIGKQSSHMPQRPVASDACRLRSMRRLYATPTYHGVTECCPNPWKTQFPRDVSCACV